MEHLRDQAISVFEVVAGATGVTPEQSEVLLDGAEFLRSSTGFDNSHPAFGVVDDYRRQKAQRYNCV